MKIMQGCNLNGEPYTLHVIKPKGESYGLDASKDGRTRQEFADECDINILLDRYEKTGVLNHYNQLPAQYLDVSDLPDLAEAINIVDQAAAAFMTLPARVRAEFENDPVKFANFGADPANIEKMREWGLAPPAPKAPEKAPDASTAAPTYRAAPATDAQAASAAAPSPKPAT